MKIEVIRPVLKRSYELKYKALSDLPEMSNLLIPEGNQDSVHFISEPIVSTILRAFKTAQQYSLLSESLSL